MFEASRAGLGPLFDFTIKEVVMIKDVEHAIQTLLNGSLIPPD